LAELASVSAQLPSARRIRHELGSPWAPGGPEDGGQVVGRSGLVVRVEEGHRRVAQQILLGPAEETLDGGADVADGVVGFDHDDHVG
jgi:hypothetical protein